MIGQLRAELVKQRSTQTTLFLLLAMAGLVALAVGMHVLAPAADQLLSRSHQLQVFQVGTRAGMLFAALAGAIAVTAEIRFGTIRPTFLVTPSRGPVVGAKLAVSAGVGFAFGLLAEALMSGAATAAFSARGIPNQLTHGDYLQLIAGGAGAAAFWGVIGVGVGALVRNQVGALVGLCAWMLLVENLFEGFLPGAARFFPGGVGLALAGNSEQLAAAAGTALLVAYTAVTAAAGWLATLRRDVA